MNSSVNTSNNNISKNLDNNDMTKQELCQLMANIDEKFNPNDTSEMWNLRLRTNIAKNFNKIRLTSEQIQLFGEWNYCVREQLLDNTSSRYDIFMKAPEKCLHIVGI